jgi:hypothetical protein
LYVHAYVSASPYFLNPAKQLFYVNVTIDPLQVTFTTCHPGKPKSIPEAKAGPKLTILDFTRHEIVNGILNVHGLQDQYVPGPVLGPPY